MHDASRVHVKGLATHEASGMSLVGDHVPTRRQHETERRAVRDALRGDESRAPVDTEVRHGLVHRASARNCPARGEAFAQVCGTRGHSLGTHRHKGYQQAEEETAHTGSHSQILTQRRSIWFGSLHRRKALVTKVKLARRFE
jgi:hypothetical protein